MKKVTIADVLHCAADKHLAGAGRCYTCGKLTYSCSAIDLAVLKLVRDQDARHKMQCNIRAGLRQLGLNTSSTTAFNTIPFGPRRQGARYAWLKFVAMLAEEQGV